MKKRKENVMVDPEYWFCYIGPIDREELRKTHPMGEGHIRACVKDAFYNVAGHYAEICGSGWEVKPDMLDHMCFGSNYEELKKALVDSYIHENLKFPRHIKAWFLLLQSEGVYPKEQKPID